MAGRTALLLASALLLAGCAGDEAGRHEATPPAAATATATAGITTAAPTPSAPAATERPRVVLVFGDSLSAAYNLAPEQGWVALLDARLAAEGWPYRMVNASISGETSAGGASRIEAALAEHRPALVVLGLGANDGLRGLPLEETERNLSRMAAAADRAGARVLVVGMRLPPNYGPEYTERFFALFGEVARRHGAAHLPFLLEPIALDDDAFQPDRLHPTAEAQPRIAAHVWPALRPLLAAP
jgi:acyl-CoA thioesterase-1